MICLFFIIEYNYMINKHKNKNTSLLSEVIAITHIAYNCVKVSGLELVMGMQFFLPTRR